MKKIIEKIKKIPLALRIFAGLFGGYTAICFSLMILQGFHEIDQDEYRQIEHNISTGHLSKFDVKPFLKDNVITNNELIEINKIIREKEKGKIKSKLK